MDWRERITLGWEILSGIQQKRERLITSIITSLPANVPVDAYLLGYLAGLSSSNPTIKYRVDVLLAARKIAASYQSLEADVKAAQSHQIYSNLMDETRSI